MASIEELILDVRDIQKTSEELASATAAAGKSLQEKGNRIGAIVRGSASGQDAVMSVSIAARSLSQAAAAMTSLQRICTDCIASLSR